MLHFLVEKGTIFTVFSFFQQNIKITYSMDILLHFNYKKNFSGVKIYIKSFFDIQLWPWDK